MVASSQEAYFKQYIESRNFNGVRFAFFSDEEHFSYNISCMKCHELGLAWDFPITHAFSMSKDQYIMQEITKRLEQHALQHGEVADELYKQLQEAKKQTKVKVVMPLGITRKPDELTKREIVDLLEKAVMDGKVPDTILFQYEAGFNSQLDPEIMALLYEYRYGKDNVKIIHTDCTDFTFKKRMLRPVEE